ncbi:MAG: RNA polymerase sigma factor SigX [candidate division WS6 bacterium OLB20]|uniref:RNA polymerase sigma factor SigX n=1 Tax=candidate division WS6 bacterium OLB20 TaxID=1617426 RepID=A0A136LW75_9BACT|nr:MAG: RNA polymerase sigma factor SigX [candidate division WS6 bacterium OLB20]
MAEKLDTATDDSALIREFCENSNFDAFGIIYEKYATPVYRSLYVKVGNKEIAEELLSDTFTTLLEILPNFRSDSSLKTFITGVAFNKARQYWQKNSDGPLSLEEDLAGMDDEEEDEEEEQQTEHQIRFEKQLVEAIMSELEPPYNEVLEMRFIRGMSINQTAEELNLTSANVRVIQHRALKKAQTIAGGLVESGNGTD